MSKAQTTKIETNDGQEFILYHYDDLTEDEISTIKGLTGDEFRQFFKRSGFYVETMGEDGM